MADVTISSLTRGTPTGGNVLPYSTGSNTLGVPVSALFQTVYSNVGVGTSSPRCSLDLGGNLGAGKGFRLGDYLELNEMEGYNNNAYLSMNAVQTDVGLFAPVYAPGQGIVMMAAGGGSGTIDFKARNWNNSSTPVSIENFTQIMRLQYDGKVGIGTTTPAAKLDVNGDVKATSYKTGSLPMFGANAFVHFNGGLDINGNASTANTERRIYAGGNVSSVLRNATGLYTIYFNTAMTTTEYFAVCSARHYDGRTWDVHCEVSNRQTTSCLVNIASNYGGDPGSTNYDSRDVDVMIIC